MSDIKLTDQNMTEIDKALAAAHSRKTAKAGGNVASKDPGQVGAAAPSEPKRPKLTDEEKAAREHQRAREQAERAARREQERLEKAAIRAASRQPAHMRKVLKAAEKLGGLGQSAQMFFNEVTTNLTAGELATFALHIQHFNRSKATELALGAKLEVGQSVVIVNGEPRYVGQTGTVVKAQRIRCYVNIEGANNRPVPGTDAAGIYFFTSDVAPVPVVTVEETFAVALATG